MHSESFSPAFSSSPSSLIVPANAAPSAAVIQQAFQEIVLEIAEVDPLSYHPKVHFKYDLALDSLDLVELVMICEKEFQVSMADHEWIPLQTPQELLKLILQKRGLHQS